MLDLPYHLINPPYLENKVVVAPGNNWDLSRKVFVTPVVQVEDVPVKKNATFEHTADFDEVRDAPVQPGQKGLGKRKAKRLFECPPPCNEK